MGERNEGCSNLNDEEFSREILPPFGSIQNLCAHITMRALSTLIY
jgi:uncharacterized damage-inducible protein DinB